MILTERAQPISDRDESEYGNRETLVLPPKSEEAEPHNVAKAARALSEAGRDILEPVGNILEDQATRMAHVRTFVRDLDSQYLRALLALHGLAAFSLLGTVLWVGLAYQTMWFLMEIVVGIALFRYIKASVENHRVWRWLRGIFTAALNGYWGFLLHNRIGAEPLWGDERFIMREELPILWVPVILHVLVGLGVLVHLFLKDRLTRDWDQEVIINK